MMKVETISNSVSADTFNEHKLNIIKKIANALSFSYGPYGSQTLLRNEMGAALYTKDGKTILDALKIDGEIADFVLNEFKAIARHLANNVGDSTTSVVLLSSILFDEILSNDKFKDYPPSVVVEAIESVCNKIEDIISSKALEFNSDEAYNIAFISSNGNKKISEEIKNIYDKYGSNIYIEPKHSLNGEEYTKYIDGTGIDYPIRDSVFINTNDGKCIIDNPNIYYFGDNVDTIKMIDAVITIINNNIIKSPEKIPTVIIAPKFSRDFDNSFSQLHKMLESIVNIARPPLAIIEATHDISYLEDIMKLTGSVGIMKNLTSDNEIDYNIDYLNSCAGTCSQIVVDGSKTMFKEPRVKVIDENGNINLVNNLDNVLSNIETKIKNENNKDLPDHNKIAGYKRRLDRLKRNVVQIFVSSLTSTEKFNKYLVLEDVATSVMNASTYGVGRAASFEMFEALNEINIDELSEVEKIMFNSIKTSVTKLRRNLISTSKVSNEEIDTIFENELSSKSPFNIITKTYDCNLKTTIKSDIEILNAVSQILSRLIITNQVLLSSVSNALLYNGLEV